MLNATTCSVDAKILRIRLFMSDELHLFRKPEYPMVEMRSKCYSITVFL